MFGHTPNDLDSIKIYYIFRKSKKYPNINGLKEDNVVLIQKSGIKK
jgi:hypothetical protein